MARIAFAWEMGGEFGHALACNEIARRLAARGHRVAFMFRELHQVDFLNPRATDEIFQAPVSVSEGAGVGVPSSLAEILIGCGYDSPSHLSGMLGGWLSLLARWKPDLVVADYAATALLACRALGIRATNFTNGFGIPPPFSPLPPFRVDTPVSMEHLRQVDARALAAVNGALAHFGLAPLATLAQIFDVDENFLATFPELDSYGNRPNAGYWGPRYTVDQGVSVHWPPGRGKRIAVYLKRSLPALDGVIRVLASGPHSVAAFIPELEESRAARLRGRGRIVSPKPMRLSALLPECDLFISQGGNVCVGSLMAGVPQLVIPSQYEQYLTSLRVQQLGAGLWLWPEATAPQLHGAIERLLGDPSFRTSARAFAAKYAEYSPAEQQRRIVLRIEELLARPPRLAALPRLRPEPILPRNPSNAPT